MMGMIHHLLLRARKVSNSPAIPNCRNPVWNIFMVSATDLKLYLVGKYARDRTLFVRAQQGYHNTA